MNDNRPKGKITIYSAGGAGTNIARQLKNLPSNPNTTADLDIVVIDTSKSNLVSVDQSIDRYLVDGLDGSGKVRSENSTILSERTLDILQQHKPGDAALVLHSGAGGSGSVIGPLLVAQLLARKVPVIVLMVGSTSSKLEAQNTLKTLKSYEAIARKQNAPVVMAYLQNSDKLLRSEVDRRMAINIMALSLLFSRRNAEMDSKDLNNWLRFNNVTSFEPQLSTLSIVWHDPAEQIPAALSKLGNVISVATLAPQDVSTQLPKTPEYQTVGILPDEPVTDVGKDPLAGKILNYVIADGQVSEIHRDLDAFLTELQSQADARPPKSSILSNSDSVGDNGLVL